MHAQDFSDKTNPTPGQTHTQDVIYNVAHSGCKKTYSMWVALLQDTVLKFVTVATPKVSSAPTVTRQLTGTILLAQS